VRIAQTHAHAGHAALSHSKYYRDVVSLSRCDAPGNGDLGRARLAVGLGAFVAGALPHAVCVVVAAADTSGDGTVDEAELQAFLSHPQTAQTLSMLTGGFSFSNAADTARMLMARNDADHDNVLNKVRRTAMRELLLLGAKLWWRCGVWGSRSPCCHHGIAGVPKFTPWLSLACVTDRRSCAT
jgi:hypothetical protein